MTLAVVEGTGEVVNTMEKVNNKLSKLKLESPESLTGDPRYTFTEEELECVKELKALCEKDGIQYTSIYELAKYQIGVWSDGPEKRVANGKLWFGCRYMSLQPLKILFIFCVYVSFCIANGASMICYMDMHHGDVMLSPLYTQFY